MKKLLIILLIGFLPLVLSAQSYVRINNPWTNRWDWVVDWNALKNEAVHEATDTFYLKFDCNPLVSDEWLYKGDTIFIDTCYTSGDSSLFYLSGDTIINKNHYKIYLNDSVYVWRDAIPFLNTGDPLAGFLTLRKLPGTNVRQIAMSSMQNMADSLTTYGIGYWELINGHLRPIDNIDSVQVKILQVDTIWGFYDTVFSSHMDTSYIADTSEFYYGKGEVSITGTGSPPRYFSMASNDDNISIYDSYEYDYCCVESGDTVCARNGYGCIDSIAGSYEFWDVDSRWKTEMLCESTMPTCFAEDEFVNGIYIIHYDTTWIYTEVPDTILVRGVVFIDDDLIVTGDSVNFTGIPEEVTGHVVYYNEANGGISYGEASSGDTSFWQRTGNYLYPKNLPDSVGIGTVTPISRLDVQNGNINLDTTSATSGQITQNRETVFHTYHEKGDNNLFIGQDAGNFTADSSFNVGIGKQTLVSLTSGFKNTAVGYQAGNGFTTGSSNVAIGSMSLSSNVGNTRSTAIGSGAMQLADDRSYGRITYNTAIGFEAMKGSATASANTGQYNTAIGYQALDAITSGVRNIAIGSEDVLGSLTTGNDNIAIGRLTLSSATSAVGNIGIGSQVMKNITELNGRYNTAVGYFSSQALTSGEYNTAIGFSTLFYNKTGDDNVAIGRNAMYGLSSTSHSNNVSVGANSLYKIGSGADGNTVIGLSAGHELQTGDNNIFLGYQSGYNETGSNKLYIENSNADSAGALIFGNFATNKLYINGSLDVDDGVTHNPSDTTTAILGKIVFIQADSSFYGCRSTTAAKKWYKLNP